MSSPWKDVIEAHMAFLADLDGDHSDSGNAVRESDAKAFTFVRGSHDHELMDGEGGAYQNAGNSIRGFVKTSEITLAVADIVLLDGIRWRVVSAVPERLIGSEVVNTLVVLDALE